MKGITLIVPGLPKAQKRHRTYTRDSRGKPLPFPRKVDPSAEDKANFLLQSRSQAPERPLEGPLKLFVSFQLPRPKSHFRTGKAAGEVRQTAPEEPIGRPDLDNLVKLVKDALAGVFYRNDSQIVYLQACKKYVVGRPQTLVYIAAPKESK